MTQTITELLTTTDAGIVTLLVVGTLGPPAILGALFALMFRGSANVGAAPAGRDRVEHGHDQEQHDECENHQRDFDLSHDRTRSRR
jgi:hypothetical protein